MENGLCAGVYEKHQERGKNMRRRTPTQKEAFFGYLNQPQQAQSLRDTSSSLPTLVSEPISQQNFNGFPFFTGDFVRVLPESNQPMAGCKGLVVCVFPPRHDGGEVRFRVRFSSSLSMEFTEDALELDLDDSGLLSDGMIDALLGVG